MSFASLCPNTCIKISLLIVCLVLPLGSGLISALFMSTSDAWYNDLKRPSFEPAGWVFGLVWTILYLLMGLSSYIIIFTNDDSHNESRCDECGTIGIIEYQNESSNYLSSLKIVSLVLYVTQLIVNFFWPVIFGRHLVALAFIEIQIMAALVILLIVFASRVNIVAGGLLAPYIFWLVIATTLNGSIVALNGITFDNIFTPFEPSH